MLWASLRDCPSSAPPLRALKFCVATVRTETDETAPALKAPDRQTAVPPQHSPFSWTAINRVILRGKGNKQKNNPPPSRRHRKTQNDCTSQMWRGWAGGLPRALTHTGAPPASHSLRLEVGSSRLGCRVGSSFGGAHRPPGTTRDKQLWSKV